MVLGVLIFSHDLLSLPPCTGNLPAHMNARFTLLRRMHLKSLAAILRIKADEYGESLDIRRDGSLSIVLDVVSARLISLDAVRT